MKAISKITSVQKVIKVGDSLAVTIPAKDAKYNGIKEGDLLKSEFTVEQQARDEEIVELTQKLISRHKQALKNLSQR